MLYGTNSMNMGAQHRVNGGNIVENEANDNVHAVKNLGIHNAYTQYIRLRFLHYNGTNTTGNGYTYGNGNVGAFYISNLSVVPEASNGSTVIDGGNIQTGSITAVDIHSPGKTSYTSSTNGFFLGDTNKLGIGNDTNFITFDGSNLNVKSTIHLDKIANTDPKIQDSLGQLIPLFTEVNQADWAVNDASSRDFDLGTFSAREGGVGDITVKCDCTHGEVSWYYPRIQYKSTSSDWIDVLASAGSTSDDDGGGTYIWSNANCPMREFTWRYIWKIAIPNNQLAIDGGRLKIRFVLGTPPNLTNADGHGHIEDCFVSGCIYNGL